MALIPVCYTAAGCRSIIRSRLLRWFLQERRLSCTSQPPAAVVAATAINVNVNLGTGVGPAAAS